MLLLQDTLPAAAHDSYQHKKKGLIVKKGDIKKQVILDTAEMLFCRNGYEQTSIQDILDRLNSSKGSFYHHFPSKEALLEGICRRRAEKIYYASCSCIGDDESTIMKMNHILSGMIPFMDEKIGFLMMLLPIFRLPEGRMVRLSYCEALSEQFYPYLCRLLQDGLQNGELFSAEPDITAGLILSIVNSLWVKICMTVISCEENHTETDISELLRLADCYRLMIERMVFLPYGSLKLIDIPSLKYLIGQIHNHWI